MLAQGSERIRNRFHSPIAMTTTTTKTVKATTVTTTTKTTKTGLSLRAKAAHRAIVRKNRKAGAKKASKSFKAKKLGLFAPKKLSPALAAICGGAKSLSNVEAICGGAKSLS